MIQLIAFLGNPGLEYGHNRHNVGWMLADTLQFNSTLDWRKKYKGLYACMESSRLPASDETAIALPDKFHFIKPHTYMNRSGESVLATASFYKIKLDEIIVVHDEIELPFGTLSLKFSGGLGGHNGLRSMKASFGSADFWRLRIGIGRPDGRIPGKGGNPESAREAGIADWVLSDFSPTETEALTPVLSIGAELLTRILVTGPDHSLPEWAKRKVLEDCGDIK
jgi:PTH1 family peptidyl-tRNA hydrolase